MTSALTLLREALRLAEARVKRAGLRYHIRGGLTPEGAGIAFYQGRHYCPSEGETFEEFAEHLCAVAEGPVILGGLEPLARDQHAVDGRPGRRGQ
jgi:hypothetical protein